MERFHPPQEPVCIAHSLQVYHPTAILHDAFAVVDSEAAGLLGGGHMWPHKRREYAKTDRQSEEKAHGGCVVDTKKLCVLLLK